eukprot:TRINITY_DN1300_c0_g3_i1.p1 TRINITY_DN1300_c0_g3~~TRINITY_DN1300_c0_g3_i1.p1  ORF type:complete len:329 (+),score=132.28 TRINITY_DN1300_c0_g3_i1:141-1127(+)
MSSVDMNTVEKTIVKILKSSDLDSVTDKSVYSQLKEKFGGSNLRPQKADIKAMIARVYQQVQDDDMSSNSDDDEESSAKVGVKRKKAPARKANGLQKLLKVSDLLKSITGYQYLSRGEVSKHVWVYIHNHELQNPENKREILCDDLLKQLFETDSINMMKMVGAYSSHLSPVPEDEKEAAEAEQKERHIKYPPKEPKEKSAKKAKKTKKEKKNEPKTMGKGLSKPLIASPELLAIIGVDRKWTWRTEVVKKVWVYIKEHDLQDKDNGQNIKCDDKLKAIMGEDVINMKQMMSKYGAHLSPLPEGMDPEPLIEKMQAWENERWAKENNQ